MKKHIAVFAIITAALIATPVSMRAQGMESNKPAAVEHGDHTAKKHRHLPFHGKVAAVNTLAKTLTVGHTTIQVTSETKITKQGKPAVFANITVGEKISCSYLKDKGGKLNATLIHIGGKAKAGDKKKKAEGTTQS